MDFEAANPATGERDFDPCEGLRRYHDAINALDFAAIRESFAEGAVYMSVGIGSVAGRDAILASFERYFATYPDQIAGDERVERLSRLSARATWWLKATHAERGDRIDRRGEETVTFDDTGRIVSVLVSDG